MSTQSSTKAPNSRTAPIRPVHVQARGPPTDYSQQGDMESNSNSSPRVSSASTIRPACISVLSARPLLSRLTALHMPQPIVWGTEATMGQRSLCQLLYQDTKLIPMDFFTPVTSHNPSRPGPTRHRTDPQTSGPHPGAR
ncbi:hypothetical protein HETIRDRAFT_325332 [Heterobasidion irregulare TC 32-1]|uniref:Uncharacterized protein n=1 Tax=Heterobasidion irregulare (strain TC 32-1) TaxID=747525 RepID=W4JYU9_HETIT|nr:uncharacterized protein HETIRDRAFT_325332 [Heterobasidion irregulare TC 32-1]ETW78265.1 hypothetical protein HETIRDRAFT_325332 [Heterobasidion irregulare TC 32-1]